MLVQSLGWRDSPGGENGNPLLYSCLKNPMDRGVWRATVQGHKESDATEYTQQQNTEKSRELFHLFKI